MSRSPLIAVFLCVIALLAASAGEAAGYECDCTEVIGTCSASVRVAPQGSRPLDNVDLFFSANASQCAKVEYYIDGTPHMTLLPDGRKARDEIQKTSEKPVTRDNVTDLRCLVCKTARQVEAERTEARKRAEAEEERRQREEMARAEAEWLAEEERAGREQEEVERLISEKVASGTLSRDHYRSQRGSGSGADTLALSTGVLAAGMAVNSAANFSNPAQMNAVNQRLIEAFAKLNGASGLQTSEMAGMAGRPGRAAGATATGTQCAAGPRCKAVSDEAEASIARMRSSVGIADSATLAYCGNMLGHSVAMQCADELDGMGQPDCAALARQEAQGMLETATQAQATAKAVSAADWRGSCGLN